MQTGRKCRALKTVGLACARTHYRDYTPTPFRAGFELTVALLHTNVRWNRRVRALEREQ